MVCNAQLQVVSHVISQAARSRLSRHFALQICGHTRFICGHRAFELLPPDLRQRCLRMRVRYDSTMNEQIVAAKKDDPVTWPEHCNDVAIDHIDEGREDNDERGDEYGGGA